MDFGSRRSAATMVRCLAAWPVAPDSPLDWPALGAAEVQDSSSVARSRVPSRTFTFIGSNLRVILLAQRSAADGRLAVPAGLLLHEVIPGQARTNRDRRLSVNP